MAIDYSTYQDSSAPSVDTTSYQDAPIQAAAPQESYLRSALITAPRQIGGDIAAGLAGTANNFNRTILGGINAILPNAAQAPINRLMNAMPAQDANFSSAYGVQNPNWIDKSIQGLAGLAPYAPLGALGAGEGLMARFAAGALPGMAQGATGSNPKLDIPLEGAGTGVGSLIPGAVSGIGSAAKDMSGYLSSIIMPNKFAKNILDNFGTAPTLEGNAQNLASMVKGAYQKATQEGSQLYNNVLNKVGSADMSSATPNYSNVGDDIIGSFDRKLTNMHNNFTDQPTFDNAHQLQSQMGTSIRKLQDMDAKGNLSIADRNTMQGYQEAKGALKSDMSNFLGSTDQKLGTNLSDQYNQASSNWLNNVVPYTETPKIAQLAKGDITNPSNIISIFKNPEPNIQKVVSDIGDPARNSILYSEFGKLSPNVNATNFASTFDKLDKNGIASYVTPDLENQVNALKSGTKYNTYLKNTGLSGAALGAGSALYHQLKKIL